MSATGKGEMKVYLNVGSLASSPSSQLHSTSGVIGVFKSIFEMAVIVEQGLSSISGERPVTAVLIMLVASENSLCERPKRIKIRSY